MIAINLVPWSRQQDSRLHRRVRLWSAVLGAYLVVAGLSWLFFASRSATNGASLTKELTKLMDESRALHETSNRLRSEFVSASASLATAREIGDHPDWGLLFSLLARLRGDDVAFETCELEPRNPGGAAGSAAGPTAGPGGAAAQAAPKPGGASRAYTLRIGGVGADQRSVAQFVLRLEGTGLFSRVSILETRPHAGSAESLIAFRIEALLQDGATEAKGRT